MEQMGLGEAAKGRNGEPGPAPVVPAARKTLGNLGVVEYFPEGSEARWRCEEFELLSAEFGLSREELPGFHQLAELSGRGWTIIRRLFCLMPVVLPAGCDPDDFGRAGRAELCRVLGLKESQLQAEVDCVRRVWDNVVKRRETVSRGAAETGRDGSAGTPAVPEEKPGEVLRRHGFGESLFILEGRGRGDMEVEKAWFARKVLENARELGDPRAGDLVRQRLFVELDLRRIEEEKPRHRVVSSEYQRLVSRQQELAEQLKELVKELDKLFPWSSVLKGREHALTGISMLVDAVHNYYATGDRTLVDGLHTLAGIEILFRQSKQIAEPRYRFGGGVLAALEARAGLWDPDWKRPTGNRTLAKWDRAFKKALAEISQESGEELPDLEKEEGEFAELENL